MKSIQTKKPTISLGIIAVAIPARMLPIIVKLANLSFPNRQNASTRKQCPKNNFACNKISIMIKIPPFDHTDYFF